MKERRTLFVALLVVSLACPDGAIHAGIFNTYYRLERYLDGLTSTDEASPHPAHASPGWYYEILSERNGRLRLRFVKHERWKRDVSPAKGEVIRGSIYEIDSKAINETAGAKVLVQTVESSVLAVPFKFRPRVPGSASQLTGSGTLGAAFAWRAKTDFSTTEVSPIVFLGLSQVALQEDEGAAAKEVQALTIATGLQVDVIGRTRLGIVLGWDRVSGSAGEDWAYQGRPWVSVGINYAFLSAQGESTE